MLIISCWLVAGASGMSLGQSQSEMIADICEENQSLGCIPAALVEHLGRPMSRLQVASRYLISKFERKTRNFRFKVKTRKKDESKRKRGVLSDDDDSNNPGLSGLTEITGHPSSESYNLGDFRDKFDPNKKGTLFLK